MAVTVLVNSNLIFWLHAIIFYNMNKKKIIYIIIIIAAIISILLVCFGIGTKSLESSKAAQYKDYPNLDNVSIWLATDIHYIDPNLTDGGEYYERMVESGDGKYMYGCEEITDEFISQVIEAHPSALILSGDITFNGARDSHIALANKLKAVSDAGIPVIALPGNHDLTVGRAAKFNGDSYELVDSIDATEFMDIYSDYGFSNAIARDDTSLSYITEVAPNFRILVVDVNTVPGMSGILTNSTLDFVEEQLKQAKEDKAYVIGVTHQTLLEHSELTSQGMTFINNDKLLDLYEKYDVLMNLSGHMHIQHIKESENGFVEIATGALMTAPNYHGEISFKGRKMTYKAVPTITDEKLAVAAEGFLWNNAYRQAMEIVSEHDKSAEMAVYFADFNVDYIAGRPDLIQWDSELNKQWDETDSFVPVYFQVVADEMEASKQQNFSEYTIKW